MKNPLPEPILSKLLRLSWAVPSDVILRGSEAIVWSDKKFQSPVLDIGCGEGTIGEIVYHAQPKIDVGMDLDPDGISRAQKSPKYKKLVVGDARSMPFSNASFKTVLSNSTFEHIEQTDTTAVSEVARVLKKKGTFFLTVPSDRYETFLKKYINNTSEFDWYNARVMHYRYRTLQEWTSLLKKNGLVVQTASYYYSQAIIPLWYRLFKIAVKKFNGRELWSYLRDSKFSRYVPVTLLIYVLTPVIRILIGISQKDHGTWLFITAKKS